ncbi:hypothetical protein [Nocardia vaccinii]|uniref:hypothetical protein n=1 Tax=Nocardia vaccinii TaxID=1822 RepID=UPI0008298D40|nr:hypothetical protein [Nocardia vaccinii]
MNNISRAGALAALAMVATAATVGVATAAPVQAPVATTSAVAEAVDSAPAPGDLDRSAAIDNAVGAVGAAFNNGANDGKLFGGAIGAALGCPIGAITGGTLTVLATAGTLTPVGIIGGCLIGGAAFGGLGTLVGGAVTGIPPLVGTATDQYNQLHAKGFVSAPLPAAQ